MSKDVNYNLAINSFLYSALGVLGTFSSESPNEMNRLVDATLCLRDLAKLGDKYTEWNRLSESVNYIIEASVGKRRYNRVCVAMSAVLGYIAAYYKAPENVFKQQRLNESLKKYWIIETRDPVYKTLFKIMPAQRIIQKSSR